jgi:DNA-binding CsgD family transcriptional regulator
LQAGDWSSAQSLFEAALGEGEAPEALDGLGQALWWQNDLRQAMELRERAYALFVRRGDLRAAVGIAVFLAREHFTVHGNFAVSAGWVARAERLVSEVGDCPERGWLEMLKGRVAPDGDQMLRHADEAARLAREAADPDLETVALSLRGLALVHCGRVAEGMAALDESMAAATGGEMTSFWSVADIKCNTLLACERAGDFERAEQWCGVVAEWARRNKCIPLFPFCHVTYAAVLVGTGRWSEAEDELEIAVRTFDAGHRAMRVLAVSRLADLRLRQGRIEEAERLLTGYEEHPWALRPVVRLYLGKGQVELALDLIKRRLAQVDAGTLMAAPLLAMLLEAQVSMGDLTSADEVAAQLAELSKESDHAMLEADVALTTGRLQLLKGERGGPGLVERALDLYLARGMPLEAARARLELAQAHVDTEPSVAAAYAGQALGEFERLGAARDLDAAAEVLRRVGAGSRTGPKGHGHTRLTQREREVLELLAAGLSNPEIAGRLYISAKTAEHHVSRILAKLNLKNRTEAAAFAIRSGPQGPPLTRS